MKLINATVSQSFADPRLGDDLLWRDLRVQRFSPAVPALFLDRDGVIIDEKDISVTLETLNCFRE